MRDDSVQKNLVVMVQWHKAAKWPTAKILILLL